jgi:hypothetical protein
LVSNLRCHIAERGASSRCLSVVPAAVRAVVSPRWHPLEVVTKSTPESCLEGDYEERL